MRQAGPRDIKIFISYATASKDCAQFLEAVSQGIRAVEGVVPVHASEFTVGEYWETEIAKGIRESHGSILILSPEAIESKWVHLEARAIDFRKHMDPATYLLMPLFAGINSDSLKQDPWQNLEVPKAQALRDYVTFDELRDKVTESVRNWVAKGRDAILSQGRVYIEQMPRMGTTELFGRENELELVTSSWKNDNTYLVGFVAAGGVGKSALCRKWLSDISEQDYLGANRIYAWSFYSQGTTERNVSADRFIQHALSWFGDLKPEEGSGMARGRRLARWIKSQPTILILDGLEPLQFPPGGQNKGRLKDKSLHSLLTALTEEPGKCLTIVTTRMPITDLAHLQDKSVIAIPLDTLSPKAGAQLLASRGVKESRSGELESIARNFGGHSLALLLLGNYLQAIFNGYAKHVDQVDKWIMEEKEGGHARRVMRSYARWFLQNDKKVELELLYVLGLFDRPAADDVLRALRREPGIEGLTAELSRLGTINWEQTVKHLRSLGLLTSKNEFEPDTLDAHPLVREHFGPELEQLNPGGWKEGHRRLYEFLAENTEEFPDDSQEMDRLYSAVNHACACGELQQAFRDLIFRRAWRKEKPRDQHYYATRWLGLNGADFVALAQFFEVQWKKLRPGLEFSDEVKILIDTGVRLRSLGRLPEAMDCLDEVVNRVENKKDVSLAEDGSYAAAGLSELQLVCGKLREAKASARIAIKNGDAGSDPYFRMHARSSLADVMMQTGMMKEAGELFEEALDIEQREKPKIAFMHSQTCYRYGNYLLDVGQPERVMEIAKSIPSWGTPQRSSLLSRAIDKLIMGRAMLALDLKDAGSPCNETAQMIDDAVLDLGQSGYADYLIRGLITQARLLSLRKQFGNARQALEKAEREAERGNMQLLRYDVKRGELLLKAAESNGVPDAHRLSELKASGLSMQYKRGVDSLTNPDLQ